MKIEAKENAVVLRPETPFEIEQLDRIRINAIKSVKFEDQWELKGGLVITFDYDWDM